MILTVTICELDFIICYGQNDLWPVGTNISCVQKHTHRSTSIHHIFHQVRRKACVLLQYFLLSHHCLLTAHSAILFPNITSFPVYTTALSQLYHLTCNDSCLPHSSTVLYSVSGYVLHCVEQWRHTVTGTRSSLHGVIMQTLNQ